MNKFQLYEHFPECLYCQCKTEYRSRIHKKSYPSREIAQRKANGLKSRAGRELYVYECPWQKNVYHLSKSSHPTRVLFLPLVPNLGTYRVKSEDEIFHIDEKDIREANKKLFSTITNFEKLQSIDGEIVINWHVLEECNFKCKYCYAEWDGSSPMKREDSVKLLCEISDLCKELKKSMRLSIAGGEPFLDSNLGFKIETAHSLGLKVSLITNGYYLDEAFVEEYAGKLDVIGFSIDSFQADINYNIGRAMDTNLLSIELLKSNLYLAKKINPSLQIKMNTVVNRYNWEEDMRKDITQLPVDKWKILRVLGATTASKLEIISDEQFKQFCELHENVPHISIENNDCMKNSYLMINPKGCFFGNSSSDFEKQEDYSSSEPILKIGIKKALEQVFFDVDAYKKRYN